MSSRSAAWEIVSFFFFQPLSWMKTSLICSSRTFNMASCEDVVAQHSVLHHSSSFSSDFTIKESRIAKNLGVKRSKFPLLDHSKLHPCPIGPSNCCYEDRSSHGWKSHWLGCPWGWLEMAGESDHFLVDMGLSENSVPLKPMVNDHYPY